MAKKTKKYTDEEIYDPQCDLEEILNDPEVAARSRKIKEIKEIKEIDMINDEEENPKKLTVIKYK